MSDSQFAEVMAALMSIKQLLEVSPTLSTAVALIMFGLGWSSAG